MPLTPSNEVVSSNVKLYNNLEDVNHSVGVETSESMDTAKVETVEYLSSTCECCLCNMPKFVVIPDVLCKAISTNNSNQSSCPVVTLHGQKLVDGYFQETVFLVM